MTVQNPRATTSNNPILNHCRAFVLNVFTRTASHRNPTTSINRYRCGPVQTHPTTHLSAELWAPLRAAMLRNQREMSLRHTVSVGHWTSPCSPKQSRNRRHALVTVHHLHKPPMHPRCCWDNLPPKKMRPCVAGEVVARLLMSHSHMWKNPQGPTWTVDSPASNCYAQTLKGSETHETWDWNCVEVETWTTVPELHWW